MKYDPHQFFMGEPMKFCLENQENQCPKAFDVPQVFDFLIYQNIKFLKHFQEFKLSLIIQQYSFFWF
jgi:hypothetical protein